MRILVQICRIAVGCLFIFSGFIKANDTIGFAYKLDEYWEVFHMHWMTSLSWALATFMCVLEMALGFMLLIGYRIKFTLWMLFLLCVFFGFLTFYSAYFDVVKSCGCFGDFLVLTPWWSFGKDMIFLGLILLCMIGRSYINPLFSNPGLEKIVLGVFLAAFIAFPLYTAAYLPIKDFRPYAVGNNIAELMKGTPDEMKFMYVLKDKQSGKEEEFDHWPPDWDKKYDYITNRPIVVKKGIEPKIKDFSISNPADGGDYTDMVSNPNYNFMLIEYDLENAATKPQGRINDLAMLAAKDSIAFVCLTASTNEKIASFAAEHKSPFQYFTTDGTVLKTMIRSNPGLILLKGGTVVAMWPWRSIPSYTDVKAKYFK